MPEAHPLVVVTITTREGDVYTLPSVASFLIEEMVKSDTLHGFASLSLVNQSQACLVVPVRIIANIAIEGEIKWLCRA